MARLGKREREDKRNLIKRNLNSPRECVTQVVRSKSGVLSVIRITQSSADFSRLMGNAHTMGFRDPQRKLREDHAPGLGSGSNNARMGDGRACRVAKA